MSRLVLSRKNLESIIIDDRITITVLGEQRVRLVIEAPPEVKVLRSELQEPEATRNG